MEVDITLSKEKYRTRKQGYKNGSYRSRAGNSNGIKKIQLTQGFVPRRRAYMGAAVK